MTAQKKILCVIPSRLKSTRLPNKPLLLTDDKPMIQWVFEAASQCQDFQKVIVATDSNDIASVITKLGGAVELTPENINTGSDRVAYVAQKYPEYDVIVNLQGDEPFVTPDMLSALVSPYLNKEHPPMASLACPLNMETEYNNPNVVKVITDKKSNALYFSRSPLPYFREKTNNAPVYQHLGMYAFTREFLLKYTQFEQTPLEKAESLEQLRALENGFPIRISYSSKVIIEVNTQEELEQARKHARSLKTEGNHRGH